MKEELHAYVIDPLNEAGNVELLVRLARGEFEVRYFTPELFKDTEIKINDGFLLTIITEPGRMSLELTPEEVDSARFERYDHFKDLDVSWMFETNEEE